MRVHTPLREFSSKRPSLTIKRRAHRAAFFHRACPFWSCLLSPSVKLPAIASPTSFSTFLARVEPPSSKRASRIGCLNSPYGMTGPKEFRRLLLFTGFPSSSSFLSTPAFLNIRRKTSEAESSKGVACFCRISQRSSSILIVLLIRVILSQCSVKAFN